METPGKLELCASPTTDQFDEYGFAVFPSGSQNERYDERDHHFIHETLPDDIEKEWCKVMDKWLKYKNSSGVKLSSLLKKGVPASIRASLWKKLLDADSMKENSQFQFQENANEVREQLVRFGVTEFNTVRAEEDMARIDIDEENPELKSAKENLLNMRQIFLDVARTFPTHKLFFGEHSRAVEGRAALFRVLAVYARFNRKVGYCQGMSFIAAMLLTILPEEDAFWCLVALLEKPKFLHGYFDCSLDRVQRHAGIFDHLLKKRLPDLWSHLRHNNNVDPLMYVTQWFMCLFTSLPAWDCVLRIWDLMLLEGVTVVFRVALALMTVLRPMLLATHDENVLILVLQRLPTNSVTRTNLLPVIFKTSVSHWEMSSIQALIDEETAEERNKGNISSAKAVNTNNTVKWNNMRQRLTKNSNTGLLKRISGIFAGRKRSLVTVTRDESHPPLPPPTPKPSDDQENRSIDSQHLTHRRYKDVLFVKGAGSGRPSGEATQINSRYSKNSTASTNEDVSRIRRLRNRNGQSQSTESLGKMVDSFSGGVASQRMAFEEFFHQRPLRHNQRSELNLNLTYSETELRYLCGPTSPPPCKRTKPNSEPKSLCGIHQGANPATHESPSIPVRSKATLTSPTGEKQKKRIQAERFKRMANRTLPSCS